MRKTLVSLVAAVALLSASAYGQETLTFSGGSGSPLSITLAQPIQFGVLFGSTGGNAPIFVFKLLGNLFSSGSLSLTGTITFAVASSSGQPFGPNQTLNVIGSNFTGGSIAATDVYIFGSLPGLSTNNLVQLNSGTLTTTTSVAAARPANGTYTTFIADQNGNRLSTNAVVPEPQSLALLAAGALGLLFVSRRSRRLS
ncbi:MAG: PEP-CTERM sorting domain-containing protein [Verrucomicrobiota bacterium]|nr:PEP-CTERM sorting domain-containing protein [Verrucomicrobiota bacterium]